MISEIDRCILNADEKGLLIEIDSQLKNDMDPQEIVNSCNKAMIILGEMFSKGERFLPDLIISGSIMKKAMAKLNPYMSPSKQKDTGTTVILGSVENDVHDIGKQILIMLLKGVGFNVIDLGVNVPAEKFVGAIKTYKPKLIGMSVLLTTCYKSVLNTMDAINKSGLRDEVNIMLGGAAASDLLKDNAGCDFYGKTAVDGLNYASKISGININ